METADYYTALPDASITVIVPALNEAPNFPALAERIDAALAGRRYKLLIVDDNSHDETPEVCRRLAERFPLRLIVRMHPKDGLSGAVLHGMAEATGDVLVVMDADLQHPPEKLPELIATLEGGDCDFTIGSRYVAGGSIEEGWTFYRKLNSGLATLLARPFAGKVADPMSGFFALRRADYLAATRLTPLGYKIGLELLCKIHAKHVREVPIRFARRTAGESKLSLREQFRYLEHLSRLYDFSFPRLSPILKFLIVTLLSWTVAGGMFAGLRVLGLGLAAAIVAAYSAVIFVTAVFHARYVRTQREFLVRPSPWLDFAFAAVCEWIACAAVAIYLTRRTFDPNPSEVLLLSFLGAMMTRYVLRKELLLDVRGLRHELRKDELTS
jgi:dolichol-phosphate mannosyltransferase